MPITLGSLLPQSLGCFLLQYLLDKVVEKLALVASKKDFLSLASVALPVCNAKSGQKLGFVLGFLRHIKSQV